MKESLKLSGVVSAINTQTGEYIFKDNRNVVIVNGCIATLLKLIGCSTLDASNFSVTSNDDSDTVPEFDTIKSEDFSDLAIRYFSVGYSSATSQTLKLSKLADQMTGTEVFDLGPSGGIKFKPVSFFDGSETYVPGDIAQDPAAVRAATVLYDPNNSGTFIRFKLSVNSQDLVESKNNKVQCVDRIGLYLGKVGEEDSNSNKFLFSQLKFPVIPFFGEFNVDFEYRMYI